MFPQRPQTGQSLERSRGHGETKNFSFSIKTKFLTRYQGVPCPAPSRQLVHKTALDHLTLPSDRISAPDSLAATHSATCY